MSFSDDAIVLESRPHGETHAIANVFTRDHGRRAALVYGGQGRRMGAILQPGNLVRVDWKGRNNDALGVFSLEIKIAHAAALMQERLSLAALTSVCAVASQCFAEREAHPNSYDALCVLLDHLDSEENWPALMARWELGMLRELGFGLTLDRCAASGARDDLVYVSPKSACAVSREAGAPYKDKLLPLPPFLRDSAADIDEGDAADALYLTGYFIETRILHLANKPLPAARLKLLEMLRERDHQ